MEDIQIPERMFATGEEPAGERVNTYHKPKRIDSIIEALEPDEVEFMQNTTFGKIISQAENPSFSGTFGQFVIVRMLKVKKNTRSGSCSLVTYQDVSSRVCACNWA